MKPRFMTHRAVRLTNVQSLFQTNQFHPSILNDGKALCSSWRRNLSNTTSTTTSSTLQHHAIDKATLEASNQLVLARVRTVYSKSSWLNPDRNPLIGGLLRTIIYNHFCAGTTPDAVRRSVARTKDLGYSGVILGYSREILADDVAGTSTAAAESKAIISWMRANLDTLDLIGVGDHMCLKFTGAGEGTSKALLNGGAPSQEFETAFDTICKRALSQGSSVWIDAEQQPYQTMVNKWAIDFMRRWNTNGNVVVYNTIQAYLKSSREYVETHLHAAKAGNWICAIKLVRGAYIQCDIRDRIWNTKAETDDNYNSIVHDLLAKSFGNVKREDFPDLRLFVAGHNKESVQLATRLVKRLVENGEDVGPVQYGQIQGMADEVSFDLVQMKEATENLDGLSEREADMKRRSAPQPYKCLIWGSMNDCLQYLIRRAVENATAAERLKDGIYEVKMELKRRLLFQWRR